MPSGCSTILASTSRSRRADVNPGSIISASRLKDIYGRLRAAGGAILEEGQTTCCYAQSEKSWIDDPAGISWEAFHTTGESTDYGTSVQKGAQIAHAKVCCAPQPDAAKKTVSACC